MKFNKVLIDDDILIQLSWQLQAEKEGRSVDCFFSIDDFLEVSSQYSKEIDIYIDSDLGIEIPGEYESKKIWDLGFKNIYLYTGFNDLSKDDFPWIKDIKFKA